MYDPANPALAKYTMAITVMMTGTPAHKIRKYEEAGICKPKRTPKQQRLYSDYDLDLIRKIKSLEQEGVNLAGIKIILEIENKQP
jgi:MerR family transcriptional regulator, heat shock protein HspR